MTNKLKTWKEITKPICATEFGLPEGATATSEIIKGLVSENYHHTEFHATGEWMREAGKKIRIEWIKKWQSEQYNPQTDAEHYMMKEAKINAFKHFFNITEEEISQLTVKDVADAIEKTEAIGAVERSIERDKNLAKIIKRGN